MCGIVGYVGENQAAPVLLKGLSKLEYRGYDSAGIAVFNDGKISMNKAKGRLTVLSDKTDGGNSVKGTMGIGHTRWATHGEPSDANSHPHLSQNGKFAVVHNGIIENYLELRAYLEKKGFSFLSETDTEVIAHLVEYYYKGDLLDTVIKTVSKIKGSYALGILCDEFPDSFVAIRKDSPLIVGLGENENFIASDVPAILSETRKVYYLEDNEIAVLKKDSVKVYNLDKEEVEKEVFTVNWDAEAAEKGGYEHFMIKEIMEQPDAIRKTVAPRIKDNKVVFDDISINEDYIKNISKIYIVACGSAYHTGIVGKYIIEKLTRVSVECAVASEFRYSDPILNPDNLVIVISQSGETADTIAALREAKKSGCKTLAVVNVVGSSIAREADDVIYTWAGPEIAVATTKAYSTQLNVLCMLAMYFADVLGKISSDEYNSMLKGLLSLPEKIDEILANKDEIQHCASLYYNSKSVFFIGRSLDYAVAMEGSLKLKEISYIHSEAYAAGELKHGTIALIEKGTLVVALCTGEELFEKMLSNIKEVKARGAVVVAVAIEGNCEIEKEADRVIYIPKNHKNIIPSELVVPLQLLSYYVSSLKGLDIDKPRNLAKSVTVE